MTTFYLIRHGQTEWNRTRRFQGQTDVALDETGEQQAARLAERLREEGVHFDALYTSDLKRASDTAQAVSAAIGLHPIPVPELREIDVGTWSGLLWDEINSQEPELMARIAAGEDLPRGGGESFGDVGVRAVAALEELAETHADQTLAVVTHGGVIRMVLRHADGPESELPDELLVSNTSISVVERDTDGWRIVTTNDAEHLVEAPELSERVARTPDDVTVV